MITEGQRGGAVRAYAWGVAIAILAIAWIFTGGQDIVVADLGDGHTRAQRSNVFEARDDDLRPGRITRNLATGNALVVCSEVFPEATRKAVRRWNDRLRRTILVFEDDEENCADLEVVPGGGWEAEAGIAGVFVSVGTDDAKGYRGRVVTNEMCRSDSFACVRQDDVDPILRTRYGRLEVIVNPQQFCRDAGAPPSAMCDINIQLADVDTDDDLRFLIAHELGHALSLADYYCQHRDPGNPDNASNRHPDFVDVPTLMNSFSFSGIDLRRTCNSPDGSPTPRDVNDYRTIYLPAGVTDLVGEANLQTVTLTWDQTDVFVESHFEIQRAVGAGWVEVARSPANAESATLTSQPGGEQRYRVVSATMALSEGPDRHGHLHGPASEEVEIILPPVINSVTASGTSLTANFNWEGAYPLYSRWILYRATSKTGSYSAVGGTMDDSESPVSFTGLSRGYWYRLQGQTCEDRIDPGNRDRGADQKQERQIFEVCGMWSTLSDAVEIAALPQPPKELDPPGLNCLTSRDTGVIIAWRTCCSPTQAATLLNWLVAADDSFVAVLKWDGSQWLRYARVHGMLVPGSTNFSISGGAVLWLDASTSTRADGAWIPPPPPTTEELERLAALAAQ